MKKVIVLIAITCLSLIQGLSQRNLILGRSAMLYCPITAKGGQLSIKSLSWLKDGKIFYKYEPSISDYAFTFDVLGVEIEDDVYFNGTKIMLGPATVFTEGHYSCLVELNNPYSRGLKYSVTLDTILSFSDL